MGDAVPKDAFHIARAQALGSVPHGFFGSGRGALQFGFGGRVTGGLSGATGDPDATRNLRRRAVQFIAPGAVLAAPRQVHGATVLTVAEPWADGPDTRPEADAVVTAQRGLALGVVTADCAPVLFVDHEAGVIGAAHAGWKGAVSGVIANTVAAMEALGARKADIAAAIGPTIAQDNYEVDEALRAHFSSRDERHFRSAPARDGRARWHFDLPGYVAAQLSRAGIARHEDIAHDTYGQPERYHSYRRQVHSGRTEYFNQISVIAMPE